MDQGQLFLGAVQLIVKLQRHISNATTLFECISACLAVEDHSTDVEGRSGIDGPPERKRDSKGKRNYQE